MAMNISKTALSLVTIAYVGLEKGPQTKITGPEEGYKLGNLVKYICKIVVISAKSISQMALHLSFSVSLSKNQDRNKSQCSN